MTLFSLPGIQDLTEFSELRFCIELKCIRAAGAAISEEEDAQMG
jgi:hypothetical protein